ncbi:aminotransferase class V-fold PLP-dependent enzyme [Gelidibacter salicanalis]|uniref:Aminotransferase class V-fold PLP-dependent enzyme n=1 Tax=Gelidibacter salicanalis TaxID=291193 RepID=A0A934KVL6_9FLAO|nr:aminotransferase class V-fold PLP-dependent enzyme [Gelidibacter salicanalis]MBJ7881078.1 aminotransferase class V-fold PLP-dependent enzyme [Gelidibacter salicanalis]
MDISKQKDLFDIPEEICYLNTASLSPSFRAVEKAGIDAVLQKSRPYLIPSSDFFDPVIELKKRFAKLIELDEYERIATIPSASYGIATVANNIKLNPGDTIVLMQEQFPSNYYSWKKLTDTHQAHLKIVQAPKTRTNRCRLWNEAILDAIDDSTAVVAMGHIHWSSGALFDLKAIRKKTRQHNALLIIDGSQSVGALPFSVKDIQPDALICAGYKWLFGPYGCAYAYYGPYFDNGEPLEENWTNRLDSHKLPDLTQYQDTYKPFANRYVMGESGSFIHVKMQLEALKQVLLWTPEAVQAHCRELSVKAVLELRNLGCYIEDDAYRSHHLFGLELPDSVDLKAFKKALSDQNIFVSFRGAYVRLSCHIFNTERDFQRFITCLKSVLT